MKQLLLTLLMLTSALSLMGQEVEALYQHFRVAPDEARTKVWWFHGEEATSLPALTADLEAFREAGVGGVVYYDQVHGKGEGAAHVMTPDWWEALKYAAREAKRLGLTFEVNMSNGYVAGGPWITPEMAMKRLCWSETLLEGGTRLDLTQLPEPEHRAGMPYWDVDVWAFPVHAQDYRVAEAYSMQGDTVIPLALGNDGPVTLRHITYMATPLQKGHQSILQEPGPPSPEFFGNNFVKQPMLGQLEASDDGMHWRKVCDLRPVYRMERLLKHQTVAFPAVTARYFRLNVHDWKGELSATSAVSGPVTLKLWDLCLSGHAKTDAWEERAAFVTEYHDSCTTPYYRLDEVIAPNRMVNLTRLHQQGGRWRAPRGQRWMVLRLGYSPTGGNTKHGRVDMRGPECDKLKREAAELHWHSYPQPIIDTLTAIGCRPYGVNMDSHEAGSQNWTDDLPQLFAQHCGYDLLPWLPAMCGWVIGSTAETDRMLSDLRRTLSDGINHRYYATLDSLARSQGLMLTAQAMGNGQSCTSDMLTAKGMVQRPQGEFWARCRKGVYDIKEASSAAHLYGQPVASAEAYTDANYGQSLDYLRLEADYSMLMNVNEMVVCASASQRWLSTDDHRVINVANGRQYCLNRANTYWPESRPFWDYQARGQYLLRQGQPVVDVLVYVGDQTPMKLLAHTLPALPEGYDFDVCSTEPLVTRLSLAQLTDERGVERTVLTTPDGMHYRMLAIERTAQMPDTIDQRITAWQQAGLPVYDIRQLVGDDVYSAKRVEEALLEAGIEPDCRVPHFVHHRTADADLYFVANPDETVLDRPLALRTPYTHIERWDLLDGSRWQQGPHLRLEPGEACMLVARCESPEQPARPWLWDAEPLWVSEVTGPWQVTFDPQLGGPATVQTFAALTDWTRHANDSVRYYSGTARYETTFRMDQAQQGRSVWLTLAEPGQLAHVYVNGEDAGIIWTSPYRLELTQLLRCGENRLRIEVTNTLRNRLIRDAMLPEEERIYHTNAPLYRGDEDLVPSGITGKVELVIR